jgi:hypothetical protein
MEKTEISWFILGSCYEIDCELGSGSIIRIPSEIYRTPRRSNTFGRTFLVGQKQKWSVSHRWFP